LIIVTVPIITAVLTIIGSVIVYVVGLFVSKLIIDPYQDYRKTVGEVAHALVYYDNVSERSRRELQDEAAKALRDKAALLRSKAYCINFYSLIARILPNRIPTFASVIAASNALIALSNSVHGGDFVAMKKYKLTVIRCLNLPVDY
jgi:hypothetical protein